MKVTVYWSEITHYCGEVEIPFDDWEDEKTQEYVSEMDLPFDTAKLLGSDIEWSNFVPE